MDSPQISKNIKELENEVLPYSENKKDIIFAFIKFYKIYIGILIIVLLLLVIIRPRFLYIKNKKDRKFCFKQLFIYWLIFSLLIIISFIAYIYYYKRDKL